MAEDNTLPGRPKKRLVKMVRSHLWHFGIRPQYRLWRATWAWASAIATSHYRPHWPLASEIGAQYVVLLLCEMQEFRFLKLPYGANEYLPAQVRRLLPAKPPLDDSLLASAKLLCESGAMTSRGMRGSETSPRSRHSNLKETHDNSISDH